MIISDKDRRILEFFGITENNIHAKRAQLFHEIHEIVFHGKGGYTWGEVYDMPVWLRRLTYKKIEKFYNDENERIDSKSGTLTNQNAAEKMAKAPHVNNTYTTHVKTPKK